MFFASGRTWGLAPTSSNIPMTQHEWQQYPAVTLQVLCAPDNQWSSTLHWRSSSWPFISFIDVHRTWIRLNWQILSILVDHHPTQKITGFNHGKCKSLYDRIIVKEALPFNGCCPGPMQVLLSWVKQAGNMKNWCNYAQLVRWFPLHSTRSVSPVLLWPVDIQRGLSMNTL